MVSEWTNGGKLLQKEKVASMIAPTVADPDTNELLAISAALRYAAFREL